MSDPTGLDLTRLAPYLEQVGLAPVAGALTARVIAGGKSNITYDVSDGTHRWVVRRPPLGHVLATAHDMAREYRVITALEPTGVPVPRTYGLCEDLDVIGAPFFVMDFVEGTPFRHDFDLAPLGPDYALAVSTRMVEVLAHLHSVDPEAIGLGDFGRAEGFLARQVRRWTKQLHASHSRDLTGADELAALLADRVPAESSVAIVHGDFRLDNLLVGDDGEVRAVLDWEMATIGDPITDLALLLAYQRMARLGDGGEIASASNVAGFLSSEEIIERYSASSGRRIDDLGFYLGLAHFKLAGIVEGIHFRYINGQTVGPGFDRLNTLVEPLILAGLESLKGTG